MLKSWPNEVLSIPCKDVKNFVDLDVILDEMHKIIKENNGLGLAAPQIGHSLNIFIIKTKNEYVEIINPVIIYSEGNQYESEGCLSFSSIYVKIQRPEQIHFSYFDRNEEKKEAVVHGMEAVCFAHEFDHLQGKTILDRINRAERKRVLKCLK